MKRLISLCSVLFVSISSITPRQAWAAGGGDDFVGLWRTPEGDGIVQLQKCPLFRDAPPTALCGTIVWDREVNNAQRSTPLDCNRRIFEANKFDGVSWNQGWAFDTRKRKFYHSKLRLKDGRLHARIFVGSEVNGETVIFNRVDSVPAGCEGRQPDSTAVKGWGG